MMPHCAFYGISESYRGCEWNSKVPKSVVCHERHTLERCLTFLLLQFFIRPQYRANIMKICDIRVAPTTLVVFPTRDDVHGNMVILTVTWVKLHRWSIRVIMGTVRSVLSREKGWYQNNCPAIHRYRHIQDRYAQNVFL